MNIVSVLVYVLVFCIVTGLLYYVIGNFCPDPMKRYAYGILYVVLGILVCYWLLGFATGSGNSLNLHLR